MQPWIKSEPGKDQTADLKNAVVPEEVNLEFKLQVIKRRGDRTIFQRLLPKLCNFGAKMMK
jgi:hypothetical protein